MQTDRNQLHVHDLHSAILDAIAALERLLNDPGSIAYDPSNPEFGEHESEPTSDHRGRLGQ